MNEKRHYDRSDVDLPLTFQVVGSEVVGVGRARDLGIGGMFVETAVVLPFGAELIVTLPVPSEARTLRLPGRLRWSNPIGMGLQFGLLGARETHTLVQLTRPRLVEAAELARPGEG